MRMFINQAPQINSTFLHYDFKTTKLYPIHYYSPISEGGVLPGWVHYLRVSNHKAQGTGGLWMNNGGINPSSAHKLTHALINALAGY